MSFSLPTIIWRHRKENLKKCSLKNLDSREDLLFFTYPKEELENIEGYIIMTADEAPLLTETDKDKGLLFIDATWRYAMVMSKKLQSCKNIQRRTLPKIYKTAYKRKQTNCPFPESGLATLEAIYLSYMITKRETKGLLDHYYFREEFLKTNSLN